jgi:hypothetical protein
MAKRVGNVPALFLFLRQPVREKTARRQRTDGRD